MGTINRQLPSAAVYMGIVLMILMAAGLICCIARDITEMSILWNAADKRHRKQETDLRHPGLGRIRHDHHTGIAENPVQGEGYQDALPCGTKG